MSSRCSLAVACGSLFPALLLLLPSAAHAQRSLPDAPLSTAGTASHALQESSSAPAAQSGSTHSSVGQAHSDQPAPPPDDQQQSQPEQSGIRMNFYYVADVLAAPKGVDPTPENWWGRIRGTIDFDFGKFTPDKGLGGYITSLWQYGTNIGGTNYVDSYANPSSLASQHVFRAAEYSLSQYLLHDHIEFRGGKIATWDSYGVQEYGESFINEPMGYAFNTFANTYMTYDPGGTPAFEMRVLPNHHWYAKAIVFSQEKAPYNIDGNGFGFHFGPPVLAAELGYLHDPPQPPDSTSALGREDFIRSTDTGSWPGAFKFGGSYNPGVFTDPLNGRSSAGNYTIWGQANQVVYREPGQSPTGHRGLGVTSTVDWSPNDVNAQNQQIDVGLRYVGLARGRRFANDMLDVGWIRTSNGSAYRDFLLARGLGDHVSEHLVEINYLAHVASKLLLQPTAEYIIHPAANPRRQNVVVCGFRIMATF